MLHNSQIDHDGAQISHLYRFSALTLVPPHAHPRPSVTGEMAPFDEIVANPSDLKHVGELLRCSDGLGVVILARAHR